MPLFRTHKVAPKRLGEFSVSVERDMCKACRFCIEICPVDVFRWSERVNTMGWFPIEIAHEENCVGCMLCFQYCPDFCIDVQEKAVTANEVA